MNVENYKLFKRFLVEIKTGHEPAFLFLERANQIIPK